MSLKTSGRLALTRPQYGENEVDGVNSAGVPNEAANLDAIDAAITTLYQVNDYTASGAISQKEGTVTLSGTGAQAMTLANPTSGTDDGKRLDIVSKSAHAHTVTTTAAISGGSNHKSTYGGAIGDTLSLKALGGVWYQMPSINQTLSAS